MIIYTVLDNCRQVTCFETIEAVSEFLQDLHPTVKYTKNNRPCTNLQRALQRHTEDAVYLHHYRDYSWTVKINRHNIQKGGITHARK